MLQYDTSAIYYTVTAKIIKTRNKTVIGECGFDNIQCVYIRLKGNSSLFQPGVFPINVTLWLMTKC